MSSWGCDNMNTSNKPSLYPEPTHKKYSLFDYAKQFWNDNHNGIVLLTIAVMLIILLFMMGYAVDMGYIPQLNIHVLSTEENVYEHLAEVI